MAGCFQDKVVFITGASSGIGAAAAEAFAKEGARVVLTARRRDRLDSVKARIEAAGGTALALACDVTQREHIDAAVEETVKTFGALDVVLANAGFGVSGVMEKLDTDDYRRQFDTNVFGVLDTVYAALPHLKRSGGRLGLVGSVLGHVGMAASAPYCASKFAVTAFAQCFYYDLADQGISVTGIYPGIVESEIRSVNNRGEYTGKKTPRPGGSPCPRRGRRDTSCVPCIGESLSASSLSMAKSSSPWHVIVPAFRAVSSASRAKAAWTRWSAPSGGTARNE